MLLITYTEIYLVELFCDQSFLSRCTLILYYRSGVCKHFFTSPECMQLKSWLQTGQSITVQSFNRRQAIFILASWCFFISNFQPQCSLTSIVTTSNGQHTVQHILEHTVQENAAEYFKITLNGSWNEIVQSCVTLWAQIFQQFCSVSSLHSLSIYDTSCFIGKWSLQ